MNQGDQEKNLAIGSLVCGIVGVVLCWAGYFSFVALVLGIVAIALSVKAGKMAAGGQRCGMAVAGLVLGIIGVVLSCFVFACTVVACTSLGCLSCTFAGMY